VGGQRYAPAALPPEKTRYPLYRRVGGPPRPDLTGLDTRTVQPVASRYTDYAIPAPVLCRVILHIGAWDGVVVKVLRY
jgi:hypothetical protein